MKFLGYIITEHGIEANPDKISAITEMGLVKNVKDVLRLIGCLVALSWFMSWLGENGLPLYKLLKKSDSFCSMEEAQKALNELKTLITKPSVLTSQEPGEILLLYIAASTQVVCATLVVEWEEPGHVYKMQRLVYYISKVLSNHETRYNYVQNLPYVVFITKRKLLHYFESHSVRVVTSHRLEEIVENHLTTGRIVKGS
jgi:hypothetical protein